MSTATDWLNRIPVNVCGSVDTFLRIPSQSGLVGWDGSGSSTIVIAYDFALGVPFYLTTVPATNNKFLLMVTNTSVGSFRLWDSDKLVGDAAAISAYNNELFEDGTCTIELWSLSNVPIINSDELLLKTSIKIQTTPDYRNISNIIYDGTLNVSISIPAPS